MKQVDDILAQYKQRQSYYSTLHSKMRTIQAVYNGTMEVPLPDMERSGTPSTPGFAYPGEMSCPVCAPNH